jgi:hypothetical protein
MSTGAWFHGISHGTGVENAYSRAAQYAAAADPKFCAKFIIPLLHAKATNQRALILRNGSGPKKETATRALAEHLRALDPATATINARSFQRTDTPEEITFLLGPSSAVAKDVSLICKHLRMKSGDFLHYILHPY